jgi:5-methylcytosine-specific restriction endonuclease McrA
MPFAPTPCVVHSCRGLVSRRGRCSAHQVPAWTGSTRGERLPEDWATRRLIVLRRDSAVCWVCGGPGADQVDHKVAGDDHSLENLAPIHGVVAPYCHRYKSSREGNQTRQGLKVKPRR